MCISRFCSGCLPSLNSGTGGGRGWPGSPQQGESCDCPAPREQNGASAVRGSLLRRDGLLSLPAFRFGFEWRSQEGQGGKTREAEREGKGHRERACPSADARRPGSVCLPHLGAGSLTPDSLKGPCEPRPGQHCHCSERNPGSRRVSSIPGPTRGPAGREEEGGERRTSRAPLREVPVGADLQKENLPSSGTAPGSRRC